MEEVGSASLRKMIKWKDGFMGRADQEYPHPDQWTIDHCPGRKPLDKIGVREITTALRKPRLRLIVSSKPGYTWMDPNRAMHGWIRHATGALALRASIADCQLPQSHMWLLTTYGRQSDVSWYE